ncbi:hypothetical protein [Nostoc sp. 2RC]|uniref:hypothetical protein n=1 Tax=Nostoc sp. 2RC TaxID=2485484 RepID=UPI001625F8DD|nr:hypothetical protein [Nostoc sp. 2RC]MBC1241764.1 hypothetical protein [Nostoc sp. 2RC]
MNKLHKLLVATTVIVSFSSIPFGETVVQAQEAAFMQCFKEYTNLGISADAALGECQKTNLVRCIQGLITKKYVAKSLSESNGRYLIDSGSLDMRWLEANGWKNKGCRARIEGESKTLNRYQWFRQGWCGQPQIEFEQYYSVDEAKMICQLGLQPKE